MKTLEKNKKVPRRNWEKHFKKMAENNDDSLLLPDVFPNEKILNYKLSKK